MADSRGGKRDDATAAAAGSSSSSGSAPVPSSSSAAASAAAAAAAAGGGGAAASSSSSPSSSSSSSPSSSSPFTSSFSLRASRAAARASLPPPPRRARFRGPAANSALGEAFLDALPLVAAVGFAADVSQCLYLCGTTWRRGDRGATNDMLVQSLRLQCGAREAHAAGREQFTYAMVSVPLWTIDGTTQLTRAAFLNNLPRVLQLIQLGAPLDLVDESYGRSALHWACGQGHVHVAKALLDGKYEGRGATVDVRCTSGRTPIFLASRRGYESVVRLLLSRGAKQELQDDDGNMALHAAAERGCARVVALLCDAPGATAALSLKNKNGKTPLAVALRFGRAKCAAVLRAHGAPK
jgi:ankyrin repeat protein